MSVSTTEIMLNLTINTPTSGTDTRTACGSYMWIDGNTYSTSNTTATHTLVGSAANGCDSIVTLNLTINMPTTGTDVQTACNSYTWIDGNTYTASNNAATYTVTNGAANGCDSIVTLNLTINMVSDITTTLDVVTITANNANATYAWLDCDNNYAPIAGQTGQSFTATVNGSYAVELTENGCVDTSECTLVISVGVSEHLSLNNVTVYPNPSNGNVTIDFAEGMTNVAIQVSNSLGQVVKNYISEQAQKVELQLNEESGVYFIEIKAQDGRTKVVKLILH